MTEADAHVNFAMRYLVKARVKSGRACALAKAIADRTLGRGSIAGDEYLYNMQMARIDTEGGRALGRNVFLRSSTGRRAPLLGRIF
jgi:hypothetical protein